MKQEKALLVMTLVARRSTAWAHDVICSSPINDGKVSDDAIMRYAKDIMDALDILTDHERKIAERAARRPEAAKQGEDKQKGDRT